VAQIPVDLVTSSGSGLDPNISVEAAQFQAPRIAAEHQLPLDQVLSLIDQYTSGKALGFLGEPRVNVLDLNVALQEVAPRA
jgi:K+-transporting ATPase ATPase C chain